MALLVGDRVKKAKTALVMLLLTAVVALFCGVMFSQVSVEDIRALLARCGLWAPLAYIALFTFLPAVFFPVAILALAGGLLFGLVAGSVYTLIGAALNCYLMFLLSRHLGRERVRRYVMGALSPAWRGRLERSAGREGFLLLVILRLIPAVPYNLINYAFGLTDMAVTSYMLASVIGIIPGTLVFINLGDKAMDPASPAFWGAVGLLLLLLVVTVALGRCLFPDTAKKRDGVNAHDEKKVS